VISIVGFAFSGMFLFFGVLVLCFVVVLWSDGFVLCGVVLCS